MDKPREFWIEMWSERPIEHLIQQLPVSNHPFNKCATGDEVIHVIEYSAYEKLKLELDAAVEGLRRIEKYVAHNGDTWVQESARAVLAMIERNMEEHERGESS